MAVNAKKPGTSLKLCNMPISMPVKLAFSTTKLLSSAIQTEKTNGIIKAMASKRFSGLLSASNLRIKQSLELNENCTIINQTKSLVCSSYRLDIISYKRYWR